MRGCKTICVVFRDCSAQIKTSQMSLLNIIHKLWGNKAIIVLQDAGIDVSGIQLDTNGLVVYATSRNVNVKKKQDCIPVECVPPARWPYPRMLCAGGMCLLPGGTCSWGLPAPGECACSQGECLLPGGCTCSQGGACSGGCLLLGGIPACTEADPPWTESHTPVKT